MAQLKLDAEGGTWFPSGEDHGKPVRFKIRAVTPEARRRAHREVYGRTKIRKTDKQSVSLAVERMEDYTLKRACFALVDTENYSVEVGGPAAAELLGKALGAKPEVGAEVFLDGKWTDELRQQVLRVSPKRAAWIIEKAGEMAEAEIDEEEAEAEDFS